VVPLGASLDLTFSGGPLPDPVTVPGVLKARSEGDFRRYGFAFVEPGRFGRGAAPNVWGTFNRREWVRVAPDRPVVARVQPLTDPLASFEGRLADVSHGGLAVLLSPEAEDILGTAMQVRCTFRPAGADRDETQTCDIRNRQLVGGGDSLLVRYGMAFLAEAAQPWSLPVYEPSWDCAACGTGRLLAHTHQHCPMCGAAPKHERTYFPPWDEVVSAERHLMSGADRTCGTCRSTWSTLARYCGKCATKL
jgi:hypothetical protein